MFNLNKFIGEHVTHRAESMFAADISANSATLSAEIKGKKVCVIGGAGSIGSSFIKAVLRFEPKSMVVVDLNENGLAELFAMFAPPTACLFPMSSAAIHSISPTPFSNASSTRKKDSTSWQISQPTNMCARRKTATACRHLLRTMT